ncbi:hypothetical protein [Lysinibacillus sp. NPDC093216]|uniref:hypothetical protein n=1 Tax=Lysinibacillus sp. NPDC093216 TaxID=3390576 RepID=UPI003D002A5E
MDEQEKQEKIRALFENWSELSKHSLVHQREMDNRKIGALLVLNELDINIKGINVT